MTASTFRPLLAVLYLAACSADLATGGDPVADPVASARAKIGGSLPVVFHQNGVFAPSVPGTGCSTCE